MVTVMEPFGRANPNSSLTPKAMLNIGYRLGTNKGGITFGKEDKRSNYEDMET